MGEDFFSDWRFGAATHTSGRDMLVLAKLAPACCLHSKIKLSKSGQNMHPCDQHEVADGKCERNRVVLGGWFVGNAGSLGRAHLLTMQIIPCLLFMLFFHIFSWFNDLRKSSWASTLAKLLAALVAVLVSPHPSPGKVMPSQFTVLRGGVGNKAIDTLSSTE